MPSAGAGPVVGAIPLRGRSGVTEVSGGGLLLRTDLGGSTFQVSLSLFPGVFPAPATGIPIGAPTAIENQVLTLNILNDTGAAIVLVPPNPVFLFGGIGAGVWAMDGDLRVSSTFPLAVPAVNWAFAFVGLGSGVWCELSRSSIAFPPP